MTPHNIYSVCQPGLLLQTICIGSIEPGRQDISAPSDALQIAIIGAEPGKVFQPHYHIPKPCPVERVTEEVWVVFDGVMRIDCYDIDHSYLESHRVCGRQVAITRRGGHGYSIMDKTLCQAIEVKLGPYPGQAADKVFL